jgi:hypothetical protein
MRTVSLSKTRGSLSSRRAEGGRGIVPSRVQQDAALCRSFSCWKLIEELRSAGLRAVLRPPMAETKHEGSELPEEARKMVTISLKDMAQRYLGAIQRSFDVAAVVVQGTREVNERGYDDLIASSRFLPNREQHRSFSEAKAIAERWILRNLLSDAFGAVVPFLEDARTICALDEWKKAGRSGEAARNLHRTAAKVRRARYEGEAGLPSSHLRPAIPARRPPHGDRIARRLPHSQ